MQRPSINLVTNAHPRGAVTPHNSIASREPPKFIRYQTTNSPENLTSLSDLGDSSSLFSDKSASNLNTSVQYKQNQSPIPFAFLSSQKGQQYYQQSWPPSYNNMVNERSPSKAPSYKTTANDQPSKQPESLYSNGVASAVPQFGQPTLPQSPLHRKTQKESGVFVQPKSRPEHHRAAPGMFILALLVDFYWTVIAHPPLEAVKDTTRKIIDPFISKNTTDSQSASKYT
jgi:hypothetical protein